jgi:hypothetical protein
MSRTSHPKVLARTKLSRAESQEKAKAVRSTNGSNGGNGSIDFSKEIGLLSSQNAKDATEEPIISDSGYINFASLYLETARLGPAAVLEMIHRH